MTQHPPDTGGSVPAGRYAPEELTPRARLWIIAGNGARQLIVPLANFVVSYLVISTASAELWGEFVVRLVLMTLTVHFLSWGNHEYLLRAFSRDPDALGSLWRRSFITRGVFLLAAVVGCVALDLRGSELGWTVLWLAAAFASQSLAVVVLFTRRFGVALLAEVAGLAVTAAVLLNRGSTMDVVVVVQAAALGFTARLVVGLVAFSGELFGRGSTAFDFGQLIEATPFFLTGLSGLLASKADLLVVSALLGHAEVGAYQVMVSLITGLQGLAAIAFTPFARDFYRSSDPIGNGASRRLFIAGVICAVGSVPAGWVLVNTIYGLGLPWPVFVIGACSVLPIYGTLPLVYELYKNGLEARVVVVSFAGAAVSVVLAGALVPYFGIVGGLTAGAVAQWGVFGWYLATRDRVDPRVP
jgi:O-antigen/teichoic acid export membrane protein